MQTFVNGMDSAIAGTIQWLEKVIIICRLWQISHEVSDCICLDTGETAMSLAYLVRFSFSLSLSQSLSVCLCLSCLFISLLIFVLSFLLFVFLPVGVCSFRCLLLSHVCLKIIVKMERKAQHNQLHMIQYQHFISSFICEIQTRKRLKRTLIYCFRFSFEKEKKKS